MVPGFHDNLQETTVDGHIGITAVVMDCDDVATFLADGFRYSQ